MQVQAPGQSLGDAAEFEREAAPADGGAPGEPPAVATRRRLPLAFLGLPLALVATCLALYLWVQSRDLDSIETRALTADRITTAFEDHLRLTAVSTFFVIVLAVPLGILLTRSFARWVTPGVVAVANIGQGVPSIGVLVLLALLAGEIGFRPAVIALVAYSFLPVLRNTMVGLQQVDATLIEAGRGMGMSKAAVLGRIELPLAVPVILAGVRTALVINVGTATLATFTNAGGLGNIISGGISTNRDVVIVVGSTLTAVLALFVDWLAGVVEGVLRPKGL